MSQKPSNGAAVEMAARARGVVMGHREFLRSVMGLVRAKYVAVVDLEATCYGPGERQDLPNEVIEVGLALLETRTGEVVDRQQWYVKPTVSEVTPFCTELTGITPVMAAAGGAYADVVVELEKYATSGPFGPLAAWVSYGEADPNYFERQSKAEGVLRPWQGLDYFNMKNLAGLHFGFGKKKNPGLKKAMGLAGLDMQGKHHSGSDDAFNTARLLAFLLQANYS